MRRLLLLPALLALGACDSPAAPGPAPDGAPRLARHDCTASVSSYAALVSGGDWGPAFRAAVAACGRVHVPAGAYTLKSPVPLPSYTEVYGDGNTASVITYQPPSDALVVKKYGPYHVVFVARGEVGTPVDFVTVRDLGFQGPGTNVRNVIAFRVLSGRQIRFVGNRADGMALVDVTMQSDTLHQQSPDFENTYTQATVGGLLPSTQSDGIEIADNVGKGWSILFPDTVGLAAIRVAFTANALVARNQLRWYRDAVTLLGGDAQVSRNGAEANPRWVRQVRVEHNRADTVYNAFWVGMGDGIHFERNRAHWCGDVCLDAEGSNNVLFLGNFVRNGKNITAVFGISRYVEFRGDTVIQDGIGPANDSGHWRDLFTTSNAVEARTRVRIVDSCLEYRGAPSYGYARIYGSFSEMTWFQGNQVRNATVDFSTILSALPGEYSGTVEVTGNRIYFDRVPASNPAVYRGAPHPAIIVGNNHLLPTGALAEPVNGGYRAWVANNVVGSTAPQPGRGIHVVESRTLSAMVEGNTVQDWTGGSVAVERVSNSPSFTVRNNAWSAGLVKIGSPSTNTSGNTTIGNSYPTGGPTPVSCLPQ